MLRELHLTGDPAADKLLNDDPFALLTGMLLDQQYPMEHAFAGPRKIADRMDGFSLQKIAATDVETFVEMCVVPPAIHRYGGSMARRVHALAEHIIENYDGRIEGIWLDGRPKPDGPGVLKRLRALPGFGEQKAKIFLALLGKQRGVTPKGWRETRRRIRRPRVPPLHRRRHQQRNPRRSPRLQEGRQGRREGQLKSAR